MRGGPVGFKAFLARLGVGLKAGLGKPVRLAAGRIYVSKYDISGDKPPAPHENDLAVPFLFVPKGQTPPADWLWAHPGAIRIPATVTLRRNGALATITIVRNEGENVATPPTARGFAPVPGQPNPQPHSFRFCLMRCADF